MDTRINCVGFAESPTCFERQFSSDPTTPFYRDAQDYISLLMGPSSGFWKLLKLCQRRKREVNPHVRSHFLRAGNFQGDK